MKEYSFHAIMGLAMGLLLRPFVSGFSRWPFDAWLVLALGIAWIAAIWWFDTRGED